MFTTICMYAFNLMTVYTVLNLFVLKCTGLVCQCNHVVHVFQRDTCTTARFWAYGEALNRLVIRGGRGTVRTKLKHERLKLIYVLEIQIVLFELDGPVDECSVGKQWLL